MNENNFKISFGKLLEREFKTKAQEVGNTFGIDFIDLNNSIPDCKLYFEYTGENGIHIEQFFIYKWILISIIYS